MGWWYEHGRLGSSRVQVCANRCKTNSRNCETREINSTTEKIIVNGEVKNKVSFKKHRMDLSSPGMKLLLDNSKDVIEYLQSRMRLLANDVNKRIIVNDQSISFIDVDNDFDFKVYE